MSMVLCCGGLGASPSDTVRLYETLYGTGSEGGPFTSRSTLVQEGTACTGGDGDRHGDKGHDACERCVRLGDEVAYRARCCLWGGAARRGVRKSVRMQARECVPVCLYVAPC